MTVGCAGTKSDMIKLLVRTLGFEGPKLDFNDKLKDKTRIHMVVLALLNNPRFDHQSAHSTHELAVTFKRAVGQAFV